MPLNLTEWRRSFSEWEDTYNKIEENPEVTLAAICHINLADLETTLQQHPSLYAYFSARLETAKIHEKRAKARLDELKAVKFNQVVREDSRLAVEKIKMQVDTDPEVQKAQEEYLGVERTYSTLQSLVKSLEHRRDMLIQLSSNKRSEKYNS